MPQVATARAVSNECGGAEEEVEEVKNDEADEMHRVASAERHRATAARASVDRARGEDDIVIEMRIRKEVSSCEESAIG